MMTERSVSPYGGDGEQIAASRADEWTRITEEHDGWAAMTDSQVGMSLARLILTRTGLGPEGVDADQLYRDATWIEDPQIQTRLDSDGNAEGILAGIRKELDATVARANGGDK